MATMSIHAGQLSGITSDHLTGLNPLLDITYTCIRHAEGDGECEQTIRAVRELLPQKAGYYFLIFRFERDFWNRGLGLALWFDSLYLTDQYINLLNEAYLYFDSPEAARIITSLAARIRQHLEELDSLVSENAPRKKLDHAKEKLNRYNDEYKDVYLDIHAPFAQIAWDICTHPLEYEFSIEVPDDAVIAFDEDRIFPTLDSAPIEKGQYTVWCASLQAAWKELETAVAREPMRFENPHPTSETLNRAADPREQIPEDNLYVAAGRGREGITERIHREMAQRFPDKKPGFYGPAPDGFVTYCYLEAEIKFKEVYHRERRPMTFRNRVSQDTEVRCFGIPEDDESVTYELRQQPAVLFAEQSPEGNMVEFAIDLDRHSNPSQIVAACVSPKTTLAETIEYVNHRQEAEAPGDEAMALQHEDVLLIPMMEWKLEKVFTELAGQVFTNGTMAGESLDRVRQDIEFKLDETGAVLKSEAVAEWGVSKSRRFIFDRPFLLCMRMRGATEPYFAMWVGNAGLLKPYRGGY